MKTTSFIIRKPLFFIINGMFALLVFYTLVLYKEKHSIQQQYQQLIIQNDSIISVNILLNDSLKQKPPGLYQRKSLAAKTESRP